MRGRIRSRDALLDIGASGPLAGMAVAIPVLVIGLLTSKVEPISAGGVVEGQCLLYSAIKWLVLGPIPEGYDVTLSPTAFAGWGGLFLTMLNLIAVGQLDGGHIAYALFGPRQNRYSRVLHLALLGIFTFNLARFVGPVVMNQAWDQLGRAIGNSTFWLVWFVLLRILMAVGGRDHPRTEPGELSPARRRVAVLSLVLFALIFMPVPMMQR
jgi:membrane-associated protease RseP (regulator of RpoE activity)